MTLGCAGEVPCLFDSYDLMICTVVSPLWSQLLDGLWIPALNLGPRVTT